MSFAHSGSITRILAYLGEPPEVPHLVPGRPPVLLEEEDFDTRERRYMAMGPLTASRRSRPAMRSASERPSAEIVGPLAGLGVADRGIGEGMGVTPLGGVGQVPQVITPVFLPPGCQWTSWGNSGRYGHEKGPVTRSCY